MELLLGGHFLIWRLIDWPLCCQSIRSHVRNWCEEGLGGNIEHAHVEAAENKLKWSCYSSAEQTSLLLNSQFLTSFLIGRKPYSPTILANSNVSTATPRPRYASVTACVLMRYHWVYSEAISCHKRWLSYYDYIIIIIISIVLRTLVHLVNLFLTVWSVRLIKPGLFFFIMYIYIYIYDVYW